MYPDIFIPNDTHIFLIDDLTVEVPKSCVVFKQYLGDNDLVHTFGMKPRVDNGGRAMFAELSIMKEFVKAGWNGRWIEVYPNPKTPMHYSDWKEHLVRMEQIHDPITDSKVLEILTGIAKINGNTYKGCWDVVAWKNNYILFAESKRRKNDRINTNQIGWFKSALQYGLTKENFLLVEWNMNEIRKSIPIKRKPTLPKTKDPLKNTKPEGVHILDCEVGDVIHYQTSSKPYIITHEGKGFKYVFSLKQKYAARKLDFNVKRIYKSENNQLPEKFDDPELNTLLIAAKHFLRSKSLSLFAKF